MQHSSPNAKNESYNIDWSKKEINTDDYDVNFVTAPWVCDLGVPPMQRVIGIIYDLIPNLLAVGALRFEQYIDVYDFALQHDKGFRYYLANADRVLCISDATRKDFLTLYKTACQLPSVLTDIPFGAIKYGKNLENKKPSVLLVNVLDWRKNLQVVQYVLERAATKVKFKLTVVGKERIARADAESFLSNMNDAGIEVEWLRDADDALLQQHYQSASLLLFPSIYEGLGLPILEAQEAGTPVISTNISSCPEVNMNPNLCFAPNDIKGMSEAVVNILNKDIAIVSGNELKKSLSIFLKKNQNPVDAFVL